MVVVATKMALSVGAGTTSADQVTGTYQFPSKGILKFYALGSATGLTYTLLNNGMSIAQAQPVPWFGATGSMSKLAHEVLTQVINPGRIELYFQKPTGGALTVDFLLEHIGTR